MPLESVIVMEEISAASSVEAPSEPKLNLTVLFIPLSPSRLITNSTTSPTSPSIAKLIVASTLTEIISLSKISPTPVTPPTVSGKFSVDSISESSMVITVSVKTSTLSGTVIVPLPLSITPPLKDNRP